MWLTDLEKALAYLREKKDNFNEIVVKKITPAADGGIVFETTYHTFIKVYRNGVITERGEKDWRRPDSSTLPPCNTIGGQMVRKMIEQYEKELSK